MSNPFSAPRRSRRRGLSSPPPEHPCAGFEVEDQAWPDVEAGFGHHGGHGFRSGFAPGFRPGFRPRFGPGADPGPGPGEGPADDPRGRRGFGPRSGPGGFGPGGFGPGGFGPGGFGPGGFGPRGFGPGGGGPGFGPGRGHRRGGRGRRGNVRAAVLALLAEEPRHGYSIMNELAERSGGLWRPSPGSVYPVLQQLQDEGLVSVEESEGRRVFSLTDSGRTYVDEHAEELAEPWQVAETGPRERVQSIMFAVHSLGVAADQVARLADDAQAARAVEALEEARRALYRILAAEQE